MTTMTLAPAPLGGDDNPIDQACRAAGTADAYDDHAAGLPLHVLEGRRAELIAHLPEVDDSYTAYVLGYGAAVITIRLHQEATTNAQTDIAYEDQENSTVSTTARRTQPRDGRGRFTARPSLSLVKPAPPLPYRILPAADQPDDEETKAQKTEETEEFVDPAPAHAAFAAVQAGIPHALGWKVRPDSTAYQYLDDGTLLTHPGTYGAPITAITTCTHGAAHVYLATSLGALTAAQESADHCPVLHMDFTRRPAHAARSLAEAFAGRTHGTGRTGPLPLAIAKGADADA